MSANEPARLTATSGPSGGNRSGSGSRIGSNSSSGASSSSDGGSSENSDEPIMNPRGSEANSGVAAGSFSGRGGSDLGGFGVGVARGRSTECGADGSTQNEGGRPVAEGEGLEEAGGGSDEDGNDDSLRERDREGGGGSDGERGFMFDTKRLQVRHDMTRRTSYNSEASEVPRRSIPQLLPLGGYLYALLFHGLLYGVPKSVRWTHVGSI